MNEKRIAVINYSCTPVFSVFVFILGRTIDKIVAVCHLVAGLEPFGAGAGLKFEEVAEVEHSRCSCTVHTPEKRSRGCFKANMLELQSTRKMRASFILNSGLLNSLASSKS